VNALDGIAPVTAPVTATATAPAGTRRTIAQSTSLGQDDFLRLMTAQLTTQDPFKPVDNTQMVAQMAQFSQVAGIAEMNASLATIAQSIGGGRVGDASGWIGRAALVESDLIAPLSDGSYRGEIALDKAADAVTVELVDADGSVVHSQTLGPQEAGSVPFQWDGAAGNGQPLSMRVSATTGGDTVSATTRSWTLIGAIDSPAGGSASRLVTPIGSFPTDAALRLA
jgi:flagellar basal-body rod modification protein FlgD